MFYLTHKNITFPAVVLDQVSGMFDHQSHSGLEPDVIVIQ